MPYNSAPDGWWRQFVAAVPARTGKLAVTRLDGSPTGTAVVSTDPAELLLWGTRIAGRYMGADLAAEYGRRNAVPPEMVVRVRVETVAAKVDVAD